MNDMALRKQDMFDAFVNKELGKGKKNISGDRIQYMIMVTELRDLLSGKTVYRPDDFAEEDLKGGSEGEDEGESSVAHKKRKALKRQKGKSQKEKGLHEKRREEKAGEEKAGEKVGEEKVGEGVQDPVEEETGQPAETHQAPASAGDEGKSSLEGLQSEDMMITSSEGGLPTDDASMQGLTSEGESAVPITSSNASALDVSSSKHDNIAEQFTS